VFDKNTVENQEVEVAYNFEPSEGVKLASLGSVFSKASKKAPQVVIKDSKAVVKVGGLKHNISKTVQQALDKISSLIADKSLVGKSYKELAKLTAGSAKKADASVHHILEQRIIKYVPAFRDLKPNIHTKIPSVILKNEEHDKITKAILDRIARRPKDLTAEEFYGKYTKESVSKLYKEAYQEAGRDDLYKLLVAAGIFN